MLPSLEKALERALERAQGDEIIIAGGAQVYFQAMPFLDRMVLSTIPMEVEGADAFYPPWDSNAWKLCSRENRGEFTVNVYERMRETL